MHLICFVYIGVPWQKFRVAEPEDDTEPVLKVGKKGDRVRDERMLLLTHFELCFSRCQC